MIIKMALSVILNITLNAILMIITQVYSILKFQDILINVPPSYIMFVSCNTNTTNY